MERALIKALCRLQRLIARTAPQFDDVKIMKNQPEWNNLAASADHGTPYQVTQEELDILQDPRFAPYSEDWRPLPKPVSLQQAHLSLRSNADYSFTPTQTAARDRLVEAYTKPVADVHDDVMLKAFNDVDTLLFADTLRHRVLAHFIDFDIYRKQCVDHGDQYTASTDAFTTGSPRFRHYIRPAIYFDGAGGFKRRSGAEWLGTLVHEMLHAYVFIATRYDVIDRDEAVEAVWGDAGRYHGPLFRETCRVLAERLGFPGLEGSAIFGYDRQR